MIIKKVLIISELDKNVLTQLIYSNTAFTSFVTKNEIRNGSTDKVKKGKLINVKNLPFCKGAFVCSQKKVPRNVRLMSPFE